MDNVSFAGNTVTVGTYLAGGGVLGAYANNAAGSASLGGLNGVSFTGNRVDVGAKAGAGAGYALGGVIGASGLNDAWTIDGATITDNSLTVHNHNQAVTAGTIYVGTDRDTANTSGSHDVVVTGNTTISGNTVNYDGTTRNRSFHFGRGWDDTDQSPPTTPSMTVWPTPRSPSLPMRAKR